jgi:hypothetical protein
MIATTSESCTASAIEVALWPPAFTSGPVVSRRLL